MGCIGYKWEWNIEKFEKYSMKVIYLFFTLKFFTEFNLEVEGQF